MTTFTATDRLKYFADPSQPRTADEKQRLIRSNPLFLAVAEQVPDLTVEEFATATLHDVLGAGVAASERTVPEADAEAVYTASVADLVAATRAGDDTAARAAAVRANEARGVLHALRDRINEVCWPWADPAATECDDRDCDHSHRLF